MTHGWVNRQLAVLGGLTVLLLVAFLANLGAGAVPVPPRDVVAILLDHLGLGSSADPQFDAVVWQIRLPRALLAALVGSGLAVSGAALQAVFRNPLAEPRVVGVAGGAAPGFSSPRCQSRAAIRTSSAMSQTDRPVAVICVALAYMSTGTLTPRFDRQGRACTKQRRYRSPAAAVPA